MKEWSYYYGSASYQRLPENDITAIGDCYAVLKLIKMMAETPLSEKGQILASKQASTGSGRFQRVEKKKLGKAWWKFW